MGALSKKIEDLMAAASFAEEGEFETARELLKSEKRVLLALQRGRMDKKTFTYALNTCKRIGAELDILFISPSGDADPLLEEFLCGLQGETIRCRVTQKTGCIKEEIINYTNARKEILFVIIESSDSLDVGCAPKSKKRSDSWQKLRCPLVVVMEGT